MDKIELRSPPPPLIVSHPSIVTAASTEGLTSRTEDENRQLQNFLDKELSKFDNVQGHTSHATLDTR